MASIGNYLIVNPRAPVRAYLYEKEDTVRDFRNLAEFENFYRPTVHGRIIGQVNSQYLFTDVLLEFTLEDAKSKVIVGEDGKRKIITPGAGKPRAGGGTSKSRVELDGKEYRSVWQAFQELAIGNVAECVKFRGVLKSSGEATYTKDGKAYNFKVVG